MPSIQQHSCGILLAKHQVTAVTVDCSGSIQTSRQQHSKTSLFAPHNELLQHLVSRMAKQQLPVIIGLDHDLVTYASLKINGALSKREINYYLKQTVNTKENYYHYQLNKRQLLVTAINKKLLSYILKIANKSKLSVQEIRPGITSLAQLLPSNDQPQALLQQEQQDIVLYHVKNQAFLYRHVINEDNNQYYLTPNLTVWVDEEKSDVPIEIKGYAINYLSSLTPEANTPAISNAYALALSNKP